MWYKILLIIQLVSIIGCSSIKDTEKNSDMYKAIEAVYLTTYTDTTRSVTTWALKIKPKYGTEFQIDSFVKNDIYVEELLQFRGDIRKSIILGDAISVRNKVYAILYEFGTIKLLVYEIFKGEVLSKNQFLISRVLKGSYVNFGDPVYHATIVDAGKNNFIIDQYVGTELRAGILPIVKFDEDRVALTQLKFKDDRTKIARYPSHIDSIDTRDAWPKILATLSRNESCPDWVATDNLTGYLGRPALNGHGIPNNVARYFVFRPTTSSKEAELLFLGYDTDGTWFTQEYLEQPLPEIDDYGL